MSDVTNLFLVKDLSPEEQELLQELVYALRTIRYGSIALTVHDRKLVEIHKTEKIRKKTLT
jgi:hypothetical protein